MSKRPKAADRGKRRARFKAGALIVAGRAAALACALASPMASGAPPSALDQGWSEAQARSLEARFERLTGFAGRARALTARVERAEGPAGGRRRLAGLPRGPQAWADGPGLEAGRSALVSASAGEGEQARCVVIQAPENLPGSVERRLRQKLSEASGEDAWLAMASHEFGHCALWLGLSAAQKAKLGLMEREAEAFADIFALEWARRSTGAPPAWGPALIGARRQSGGEHAVAPELEAYWGSLRGEAPAGSACEAAWSFSGLKALGRPPC